MSNLSAFPKISPESAPPLALGKRDQTPKACSEIISPSTMCDHLTIQTGCASHAVFDVYFHHYRILGRTE